MFQLVRTKLSYGCAEIIFLPEKNSVNIIIFIKEVCSSCVTNQK